MPFPNLLSADHFFIKLEKCGKGRTYLCSDASLFSFLRSNLVNNFLLIYFRPAQNRDKIPFSFHIYDLKNINKLHKSKNIHWIKIMNYHIFSIWQGEQHYSLYWLMEESRVQALRYTWSTRPTLPFPPSNSSSFEPESRFVSRYPLRQAFEWTRPTSLEPREEIDHQLQRVIRGLLTLVAQRYFHTNSSSCPSPNASYL